jgi:hypothetical protein
MFKLKGIVLDFRMGCIVGQEDSGLARAFLVMMFDVQYIGFQQPYPEKWGHLF